MPNLAIVYNNHAPYFRARLRAAATLGNLTALPLTANNHPPDAPGNAGAERVLLNEREYAAASAGLIASRVHQALSECVPDVAIVHGWSRRCALATLAWAWKTRTPTVMLGDFQVVGRRPGGVKDCIKRRLLRNCGAFLLTGRAHAQYLAALGLPGERIFVGFGVADNSHFADGAARARSNAAALRKELGLPERYILAVSRLSSEKNLHFLLAAYAAYRRRAGPQPWKLVIAGDGPLLPVLLLQRERLDIAADVFLIGYMTYDRLPACYGLASAFVHASIVEPWGMVVNEAMAAGLPVFVSDHCGCAPDLVANGRNGFTFDPRDETALTELLLRAASGEMDLEAMGRQSAAMIGAWSPEAFGKTLWHAADEALRAPRPEVQPADSMLAWMLMHRPRAPL